MWSAGYQQADAELANLEPYPIGSSFGELHGLLGTYQGLERNAPSARAEAGIGKCLCLLGRYGDAATAFHKAGVGYAARELEALTYAEVARQINRLQKNLVVRQLRHIAKSDEWVALLTSPDTKDGWNEGANVLSRLELFQFSKRTKRAAPIGKELVLPDLGWVGEYCTLYLSP